MRGQQIPVVILAGFLGAGKTTLLNHLLHSSRGSRIAVLVNDFGSIEIDAMTVAGQVGSAVSLGNGCLCCAVDIEELDEQLALLTRPAHRVDLIVIEASGLAEPAELVRMVLASENPGLVYGGLVEVVDGAEFRATRQRHPEIGRHLGAADLVVLNKTDRLTSADRAGLLTEVTASARGAAVVPAAHGRIDPDLLFDRRPARERVGQLSFDDLRAEHAEGEAGEESAVGTGPSPRPRSHLHEGYESVSFTCAEPLDPVRLMSFLDHRPEGLYRIKGYVDFGPADPLNRYAVHAVGRFLRFYPEPWPRDGAAAGTQLVLIGAGIDAEGLRTALDGCRADSVAPADATALLGGADADGQRRMWGVLRYVQEPGTAPDTRETREAPEPEETDERQDARLP
ncbi:CobW family GTP-binding protein [Streptomyces sp. NPDC007088]|uniref:CobW family GTP-binding protein n=1 Tax=Streptomyces sp. NPDC007088 TaxID=3364773 RepID=UPI0036AA8379